MRYVSIADFLMIAILFLLPVTGSADFRVAEFAPQDEGLLLTLSGSNTIGGALAPAWARAFLQAKGARQVTTMALTAENEYRVVGRNSEKLVFIDIRAHGSSTGFVSLENSEADIAMSSRPIKALERDRLMKLGDLFEAEAEHVVAIDGLAIVVHPENPVQHLSVEAIAGAFTGDIRNWRDLGGPDRPIHLYARDQKSGTWDTFQTLLLGDRQLSQHAARFESNDALSDRVAADPGAIGFVGLASVRNARALAVHHGGSPAMAPEKLFVATEDYPLARRLYLYKPTAATHLMADEFIGFAQHETGQALVEEVGFVAQTPTEIAVVHQAGPEFYQTLAEYAQRLSLNFRFRPASAELDSKAKRDVKRLADYLKQQDKRELRIQLVGFSNQKKDTGLADVLSRLRATAVKTALFEQGVITESVMGFGATRPLSGAKNGNSKNDRVEVWLYPDANTLAVEQLKMAEPAATNSPLLKLANQP